MPKNQVIKPTQRKTTMVLMDDGSQLSVEELLHKLKGTRIHGVEYQNLCQCDGSNHEAGMGCM